MMINYFLLFLWVLSISTGWYVFLHKKTRINKKYIYTDNLVVIGLSLFACWLLYVFTSIESIIFYFLFSIPVVIGFSFIITMIRFWRTPIRKMKAKENEMVSPADGKVLYINKFKKGETPISIKRGLVANLKEITTTDIIETPVWIIGINMTPFDVHKNCTPIEGEVILVKHIHGKFLSLKEPRALIENERVTVVLKTKDNEQIGIVQTASRLVRRIDTYVKVGDNIEQGAWYGMIRFGSQVDLIIPDYYDVKVHVGQQLFAKSTIIAAK